MEGGIKAMLAISKNAVKRFEKEHAMNLDINPLMLSAAGLLMCDRFVTTRH